MLAITLGACGGSDGSEDPLAEALAFMPADAAVSVAVSTDLESPAAGDLDAALQRFGVEGGLDSLFAEIAGGAVSFEADIRPQLGSDAVLGLTGEGILTGGGDGFLLAISLGDPEAIEGLLESVELSASEPIGDARVFGVAEESDLVAVAGDVLLVASGRGTLEAAVERRERDAGLGLEEFEQRLGPEAGDDLLRIAGDAQSLLAAASLDQLAEVPWIAALETYGVGFEISGRDLTIEARIDTQSVPDAALPIAPGPRSPALPAEERALASRDQAQSLRFALEVVRAGVPAAAFEELSGRLSQASGVRPEELIAEIGSGVLVEIGDDEIATRSELENPGSVREALDGLADEVLRLAAITSSGGAVGDALSAAQGLIPVLPIVDFDTSFGEPELREIEAEPGLYRLRGPVRPGHGLPEGRFPRPELVFGVIDGLFVTAPSLPAARRIAGQKLEPFDGPPGAVAITLPLTAADFGLGGGREGDVTVAILKGALEARSKGLRLRLGAEL